MCFGSGQQVSKICLKSCTFCDTTGYSWWIDFFDTNTFGLLISSNIAFFNLCLFPCKDPSTGKHRNFSSYSTSSFSKSLGFTKYMNMFDD